MMARRHHRMHRPVGPVALALVMLGLLAIPSCTPDGGGTERRPNVLLIVLDTTRADFLSCYDGSRPTTPAIDRLAESGTRYERAFSTCPWTLPSHASLFTGLYPTEVQATSETLHLPGSATTLAERLREAGYRTRAAVANPFISRKRGFDRGFEEFVETWRPPRARPPVQEPLRWIREFSASGEPFFVFLNFNTPHMPYNPAPAHRRRFLSSGRSPADVQRLSRIRGMYAHYVGQRRHDAEDFEILRELYAAEIHATDGMVGRVLDALKGAGMLDDTLVVVVSDHGENIGDHGQMGHALSMHETLLRVPLVIRYPKRFPPGTVDTDLQSLVDILPTVLDACGVVPPAAVDHVERRSLCRAKRERREFVVSEDDRPVVVLEQLAKHFPDFDATSLNHRVRTIRDDRHKLVWRMGRGTELYDLAADPGETTDLAGTRPELERELLEKLKAWVEAHPAVEEAGAVDTVDPEALERLRALGYIR